MSKSTRMSVEARSTMIGGWRGRRKRRPVVTSGGLDLQASFCASEDIYTPIPRVATSKWLASDRRPAATCLGFLLCFDPLTLSQERRVRTDGDYARLGMKQRVLYASNLRLFCRNHPWLTSAAYSSLSPLSSLLCFCLPPLQPLSTLVWRILLLLLLVLSL